MKEKSRYVLHTSGKNFNKRYPFNNTGQLKDQFDQALRDAPRDSDGILALTIDFPLGHPKKAPNIVLKAAAKENSRLTLKYPSSFFKPKQAEKLSDILFHKTPVPGRRFFLGAATGLLGTLYFSTFSFFPKGRPGFEEVFLLFITPFAALFSGIMAMGLEPRDLLTYCAKNYDTPKKIAKLSPGKKAALLAGVQGKGFLAGCYHPVAYAVGSFYASDGNYTMIDMIKSACVTPINDMNDMARPASDMSPSNFSDNSEEKSKDITTQWCRKQSQKNHPSAANEHAPTNTAGKRLASFR